MGLYDDLLRGYQSENIEVGLEARNILKDKTFKLNKSSFYVAEKSINEAAIVFSFLDNYEDSLMLFKQLKNRKHNLIVSRMKYYFMPKIIKQKLPSKSVVENLSRSFNQIMKIKNDYGIMQLISNAKMVDGKNSYMVDMSWVTNAIRRVTVDKKMRVSRALRDGILAMYKAQIESFTQYKNKILYFRTPFLLGTPVKLTIMENALMTSIRPVLLFMKWFQDRPDEFKEWLNAHNITMVFEGNKNTSLVLAGNNNYLNMSMFKPKTVLRQLHILDSLNGKLDAAKEQELADDVDSEDMDENVNLATDDEMYDSDNPNEVIKLDEDLADADIADIFENGSDDIADATLAKPKKLIIEENKDLADDVADIEIMEASTAGSKRGYNKDYFKILEDSNMSPKDKAVEIVEEHNYTKLKENVETKEIQNMRKAIVKKYGKKPAEMVEVIKKHEIKDQDIGIVTKTPTSFTKISTKDLDTQYKKQLSEDDFENILAAPAGLTYPLILKGYTKKDISDREFKGYELKVQYETHNGDPLEIVLDIPETFNSAGNIFMGGSAKQIKLQNAAKPVIKQDENVIITTAYNKCILSITGKYISMSDKILISHINAYYRLTDHTPILKVKTTDDLGYFIYENQISFRLTHFNRHFVGLISPDYDIDFRGKGKKNGLTLLGTFKGEDVLHDPDKDTVKVGNKTYDTISFICSILENENPEAWKKSAPSTVSTASLYTPVATIMGTNIPVVLVLLVAKPLRELLNLLRDTNKLEYKVVRNSEEVDKFTNNNKEYGIIKFANFTIILKYNNDLNNLLLNYLTTLDFTDKDTFDITNVMEEFAGNSNTAIYIENFVDLFIDPITKRVCELYNIPSDFVGMFIYAVSLFTTYKTTYKGDIRSYRLITPSEIINRCVYDVISKELSNNAARVKRGSRAKVNIAKDAVIQRLQSLPNINEANGLSAFREVMEGSQVSLKGHNGINEPRAYTNNVRMFNQNNYGSETCATAYSGNAGIVKYLPVNPTVTNLAGDYEHHDGPEGLDAANLSAFSDAYVPYTRYNHCARRLMQSGQFNHILPAVDSDPMLVSSYADEAAIKMTPKHSYIAKGNGKIKEMNKDFIIIEYDNKEVDAISLINVERNADKGYYVKNDFVPNKQVKVGYKFKEGEILAYSKDSYRRKTNGHIGLAAGALVWVLTCDGEAVWEDSCLPFENLSNKLATRVVKRIARIMDLNTEIRDWKHKIGEEVKPNDVLFKYKVLTDDDTINELFSNMESLSLKEVEAHYKGTIVDIRVYWRESQNMSLSKSMKDFIRDIDDAQRISNNMASVDQVTDQFTRKLLDKRPQKLTRAKNSKINGDTIENGQILIEYSIEIIDKLGPGDKIVVDNALKGEPTMILPNELRPVGVRTKRHCDLCYSTYSILKRMTPGMIQHGKLVAILLHIARKNREILGIPPEPGSILDYYSSEDMIKKYNKK